MKNKMRNLRGILGAGLIGLASACSPESNENIVSFCGTYDRSDTDEGQNVHIFYQDIPNLDFYSRNLALTGDYNLKIGQEYCGEYRLPRNSFSLPKILSITPDTSQAVENTEESTGRQ